MAVTAEQLKGRVRALFPNANLSTVRISKLIERLSTKLTDDSTEEDADGLIKDFNDNGAMTFEEIAKSDDKLRTFEASRTPKVDPPKTGDPNPETDPMKLMLKAITDLTAKVSSFEQEKQKESITTKFANDERVKNIPAIIRKGFTPTSDEDYETNIEALVTEYKPYAEKLALAGFKGDDTPNSSTGGADAAKGKVKEKTADETKDLANSI